MILIGMYDSPFVRRVAIALRIYGMSYEHRPWSVFRDADKIAPINPLIRVPTLVLDDGEMLTESAAILDALDDMVGPERALMPADGPERRRQLQLCAIICGMADKIVSLIYERNVHKRETEAWVERCRGQIAGVLDRLEADRKAVKTPRWFGDRMGHADIALGCVMRLAEDALGGVMDAARWPAIAAHCQRCEANEHFKAVQQPFFAAPIGKGA